MATQNLARSRFAPGRILNGLAIVAIVVPGILSVLAPPMRGECATTLDNFSMIAGFGFLAARLVWIPLRALNDACTRAMDARELRDRPIETSGPPSTP